MDDTPDHAARTRNQPVLRPWTGSDADAQAVLRAFEAPGMAGQSRSAIASLDDARAWTAALVPDPSDKVPRSVAFAIDLKGTAVGHVMVSAMERRHLTGWVSYWVASSARGRGLAAAGAAGLAEYCFAQLGLYRLELGHRVNNPASGRVAAAAGFTQEGIERQKLRYQDDGGTWQRFDTALWARLATDPVPVVVPLEVLPGGGTVASGGAGLSGPRKPFRGPGRCARRSNG